MLRLPRKAKRRRKSHILVGDRWTIIEPMRISHWAGILPNGDYKETFLTEVSLRVVDEMLQQRTRVRVVNNITRKESETDAFRFIAGGAQAGARIGRKDGGEYYLLPTHADWSYPARVATKKPAIEGKTDEHRS